MFVLHLLWGKQIVYWQHCCISPVMPTNLRHLAPPLVSSAHCILVPLPHSHNKPTATIRRGNFIPPRSNVFFANHLEVALVATSYVSSTLFVECSGKIYSGVTVSSSLIIIISLVLVLRVDGLGRPLVSFSLQSNLKIQQSTSSLSCTTTTRSRLIPGSGDSLDRSFSCSSPTAW